MTKSDPNQNPEEFILPSSNIELARKTKFWQLPPKPSKIATTFTDVHGIVFVVLRSDWSTPTGPTAQSMEADTRHSNIVEN